MDIKLGYKFRYHADIDFQATFFQFLRRTFLRVLRPAPSIIPGIVLLEEKPWINIFFFSNYLSRVKQATREFSNSLVNGEEKLLTKFREIDFRVVRGNLEVPAT